MTADLAWLAVAPPTLTVVVRHPDPVGQGRIAFSKQGRGYHSNGKRLRPWRAAVTQAAAAAWAGPPLVGPVVLEVTVTVPKPKSAPKRRTTWPVTRTSGDWDHLGRAVSDALSDAAVWGDDSQVVEGTVRKVYPDEGLHALEVPGAVIQVWAVAP